MCRRTSKCHEVISYLSYLTCPALSLFSFSFFLVFVLFTCRWEPEHGQRHQQPGAVSHSLSEEAGAGRRPVSDGAAAPGHSCGRPPPAHHSDEVCWGLRLQGGVRGKTPPPWPPWPPWPPALCVTVTDTNEGLADGPNLSLLCLDL